MEQECEEIALRCAKENIDHLGSLLPLAERELLDREARATERRLKTAKFPSVKTLESFDFRAQPSLNKMLVNELMRGGYIVNRENLILIGQPGSIFVGTSASAHGWFANVAGGQVLTSGTTATAATALA